MAQRRATPAQATIVYSTEIVLSTIWATCLPASIVDRVEFTAPIVVGCILIVVGNLIEIAPIGRREGEDANEPGDASDLAAETDGTLATRADDMVSEMLARVRKPLVRKIVLFACLLAVYLVIALPFKVLDIIPGFADVRPVTMLMPVYGIFFGIPGCLANAVGNLVGDIVSDSLRWSSIAGFIGNFAYPYLMYLFWTKLRRKPFALRTGCVVVLFALTVVICACVQSLIISPVVQLYYPDVDIMLFAMIVVGNGTFFPIGFAIPFIILLQEEFGFSPLGPKSTIRCLIDQSCDVETSCQLK